MVRWLDVVKDYDCKMYHPGKANVGADAFSYKVTNAPIWDLCLWMTITSLLLDLIKEAQVEGLKRDNWKEEMIKG